MLVFHFRTVIILTTLFTLICGHARIKYPRPLAAPTDGGGGNYYNEPLKADGRDFPCKGLHKNPGINRAPTATWKAGQEAYFEILGHNTPSGEGSLAAHSGGSCQASLSFDNGETWKVLHSYQGGCPRNVSLDSNMAGKDQTFSFLIPENTRAGNALFSWTWIAVTGNRNEMFQNCASVKIEGSGTSTLDDLPDMFVGDMTIAGHIGPGECRSSPRAALEYPNPGNAITITEVQNITFVKPTNGTCYARSVKITSTTTAKSSSVKPSTMTTSTIPPRTQTSTPNSSLNCEKEVPPTLSITINNSAYPCSCVCEKPKP